MSSTPAPPTGTSLMSMDVSYTSLIATLVLLLAVSSAIIIRSLILRRRHQRLVEEAIRTGNWLPHHFSSTSRRRRDIGQKPKLWEAWLNPKNMDDGDGDAEESEKRNWGGILPVYAAYVNPPTPSPQEPTGSSAGNAADPLSRSPRFMQPFTRRRSPPSPQLTKTVMPTAGQAPSSPSSPLAAPTPTVRVAVLIAMPDASRKYHGDDGELSVVEIGVVDVNVKDDDETLSRDS